MKTEYERYERRTEELERNLTISDRKILEQYLQYCSMTSGKGRLKKCRCYMLQFRDIMEKPLDLITKEDAIAFWGLVNDSPYELHTKIGILRIVKRFLKWYYRDLDLIEPLRIPEHLVNNERVNKRALLTPDELQLMLHRAERLRDKALLVLFYETAARPQEIRDLKWHDIDWEESEVHLYSKKTRKDRDLPINDSLSHLKRWKAEWVYPDPQEDDFIFPSIVGSRHDRKKPISVSYINRIVKSLARKAGIRRNVFTYLLRHTRLTEIRKRRIQGIEFNKFAGHKLGSSKREAVYIHLDNEDMKRSMIEKVYKIQELPKSEKNRYEQRIADKGISGDSL